MERAAFVVVQCFISLIFHPTDAKTENARQDSYSSQLLPFAFYGVSSRQVQTLITVVSSVQWCGGASSR